MHILPPERLRLWRQSPQDAWAHADLDEYLAVMDAYHVECALLMPANDARLYYEDANKTNQWLGEVQTRYPGRFYAFADILKEGAYFYEDTPDILERAVKE